MADFIFHDTLSYLNSLLLHRFGDFVSCIGANKEQALWVMKAGTGVLMGSHRTAGCRWFKRDAAGWGLRAQVQSRYIEYVKTYMCFGKVSHEQVKIYLEKTYLTISK